jgi:hypothetical protein
VKGFGCRPLEGQRRVFGGRRPKASKGVENHAHSVALFAMYYNFVRVHKTLRVTPAMAANVTKRLWEMSDIVDALEAWESIVQLQAA